VVVELAIYVLEAELWLIASLLQVVAEEGVVALLPFVVEQQIVIMVL
jgi:hypothetical protein